jgi:tetratricopeptide (TPR) repeat protein
MFGLSCIAQKPLFESYLSTQFQSEEFQITTSTGKILQMAQKATPKKSTTVEDPRAAHALQNYEAGLRALQEHKFDKAKPLFQKVLSGGSRELSDRATIHLSICNQHLERSSTNQFKTVEEHFDYAVSLMNVGDYVTAREHLDKLVKQAPKTDFVIYGLAALDCLTGHVEDSLRHLDEALRLNAALRYQARNDTDFHNLAEDPRFTELLYPDPAADQPSSERAYEDESF